MTWEVIAITSLLAVCGSLLLVFIGALGYGFNRLLNLEVRVAEADPPAWFEPRMKSIEDRLARMEGKVDQIRNGAH